MTGCLDKIETFSLLDKALVDLPLAPAKDPDTSTENVWRKAGARNRITPRERSQNRADQVILALDVIQKSSIAEIDIGILPCLRSLHHPPFDTNTNVPHEKVFEIDATPPGVISLDVAIIYPISSRESVCPPKRDV